MIKSHVLYQLSYELAPGRCRTSRGAAGQATGEGRLRRQTKDRCETQHAAAPGILVHFAILVYQCLSFRCVMMKVPDFDLPRATARSRHEISVTDGKGQRVYPGGPGVSEPFLGDAAALGIPDYDCPVC